MTHAPTTTPCRPRRGLPRQIRSDNALKQARCSNAYKQTVDFGKRTHRKGHAAILTVDQDGKNMRVFEREREESNCPEFRNNVQWGFEMEVQHELSS